MMIDILWGVWAAGGMVIGSGEPGIRTPPSLEWADSGEHAKLSDTNSQGWRARKSLNKDLTLTTFLGFLALVEPCQLVPRFLCGGTPGLWRQTATLAAIPGKPVWSLGIACGGHFKPYKCFGELRRALSLKHFIVKRGHIHLIHPPGKPGEGPWFGHLTLSELSPSWQQVF